MDRSPSYRLLRGSLFLIPLVFCSVGEDCATITRGGSETLAIESDPSSAKVTLSSGNVCTTPCWIAMKRTHDYHVKIEKAGYQTIDTNILRKVAGAGVAGPRWLPGIGAQFAQIIARSNDAKRIKSAYNNWTQSQRGRLNRC